MQMQKKFKETYPFEKIKFADALARFADSLESHVALDGEWTIKGFIDVFRNVYTISADTKVISKLLELHIFPNFVEFADRTGYSIEPATHQNWYPDLTFLNKANSDIKFAVDLKTTYTNEKNPNLCNGFTLGSHGTYFVSRDSKKNIQYPYNQYSGHFCLGIIYSRAALANDVELKRVAIEHLADIRSVIKNFTFFVAEKWKLASDKAGSGNTANIGSIKGISDILAGNGTFAKAGEEVFDEYWANYGKIKVPAGNGTFKNMTSFDEYIAYTNRSFAIKN